MRRATIGDTVIKLNNRDYQTLLNRTNLKYVKCDIGFGWYGIKRPCICDWHTKEFSCYKCPLINMIECDWLFRLIAQIDITQTEVIGLTGGAIFWSDKNNEEARAGIRRVHDWLLSMEVV